MGLQLQNISKSFGDHLVLSQVNLELLDRGHYGLIGANGTGKSTLLNLIAGLLEPDSGEIFSPRQMKIGFLKQDSGLNLANTIAQEMDTVYEPLAKILTQMQDIEKKLSITDPESQQYGEMSSTYTSLQNFFEIHDGYHFDVKMQMILNGMGFQDKDLATPVASLSGGEKTRMGLAKLLLEEPTILLLDEPTNHLDFKTLRWLEAYLSGYKGIFVIISHDRYFLDRTVQTIWEVENKKLFIYPGNYTKYLSLKEEKLSRSWKEYESQQKEIDKMEDYVRRNIARASTSNSAKGRRKALDRMEVLERPAAHNKRIRFQFDMAEDPYHELLTVSDLNITVGRPGQEVLLCQNINLAMERGEKIAIIGENGVGKSTFLKQILRKLPVKTGGIRWGENAKIGYYEQEVLDLNPNQSVIDELWNRNRHLSEYEIRSKLASVGIIGEEVFRQVGVMSGGEKAKLKFAILSTKPSNVLILDEPTNHLDLPSKEILESALADFPGSLLFVSHDRYLLEKIPTKIIEITPTGIEIYPGNYSDYEAKRLNILALQAKEKSEANCQSTDKPAEQKQGGYRSKKDRNREIALKKKIQDEESNIALLEKNIEQLALEIEQIASTADYVALQEKTELLADGQNQLLLAMDRWATLLEEEKDLD